MPRAISIKHQHNRSRLNRLCPIIGIASFLLAALCFILMALTLITLDLYVVDMTLDPTLNKMPVGVGLACKPHTSRMYVMWDVNVTQPFLIALNPNDTIDPVPLYEGERGMVRCMPGKTVYRPEIWKADANITSAIPARIRIVTSTLFNVDEALWILSVSIALGVCGFVVASALSCLYIYCRSMFVDDEDKDKEV